MEVQQLINNKVSEAWVLSSCFLNLIRRLHICLALLLWHQVIFFFI